MDSYVVRIYRRSGSMLHDLVGLVELVETDEEKAFTSFEELRSILNRKQGHPVSRRKSKPEAKDRKEQMVHAKNRKRDTT